VAIAQVRHLHRHRLTPHGKWGKRRLRRSQRGRQLISLLNGCCGSAGRGRHLQVVSSRLQVLLQRGGCQARPVLVGLDQHLTRRVIQGQPWLKALAGLRHRRCEQECLARHGHAVVLGLAPRQGPLHLTTAVEWSGVHEARQQVGDAQRVQAGGVTVDAVAAGGRVIGHVPRAGDADVVGP